MEHFPTYRRTLPNFFSKRTSPLTFAPKTRPLKITIVCGHYLPSLGYLEVHLSLALAADGHDVSVVTTTAVPGYVKGLQNGFGQNPEGVQVTRLKPVFSLGQVVVARGLKKTIQKIAPELIIVIGLGKRFPKPVFDLEFPTITLFGDNAWSYRAGNAFKTHLVFNLLKKSTYQKAIDRSNKLVAYTPESFYAAATMLSAKYRQKLQAQHRFISLGFWPDEFYFDQRLREIKRSELRFQPKDVLIITATRLVPEKKLETAIGLFEQLPANFSWMIIGSAEDGYSEHFEAKLNSKIGQERFRLLPYQNRQMLNELYNAADVALYTVPAISIFEALGTGLPLVLPNHPSFSHIIESSHETVAYKNSPVEAVGKLLKLKDIEANREKVANYAENQFSWQKISRKLLGHAGVT
jgi:glycosyltransferase involved in cell wall biosynthesis